MKLFLKKNDQNRKTEPLRLGKKGRMSFAVYAAVVVCAVCLSTTVFAAATDPLTVVNNEHYMKGANGMSKMRTMAFQVSEEFFQRIKDYLTRYEQTYGKKLSQKDFVIGLIEQALEEADEEFEAAQAAQEEAAGDSHEPLEDIEEAEDEETANSEEQSETGEEPEEVTEPQEEQETTD